MVRPPQDAQAVLYTGTAAEQNHYLGHEHLHGPVSRSLGHRDSRHDRPVTVTVATDNAGIIKKAEDLIKSVNDVLGFIADNSAVTATTNAHRRLRRHGWNLHRQQQHPRRQRRRSLNAVVAPVNGKSPSEYGIVITRNGDFTFDKDKFAASLAADPAGTQAALSRNLASRVAAATNAVSDSVSGTVPQLITGRQSEVSDLNDQISDWDTRLETRRASLKPSTPTWKSCWADSRPSHPG